MTITRWICLFLQRGHHTYAGPQNSFTFIGQYPGAIGTCRRAGLNPVMIRSVVTFEERKGVTGTVAADAGDVKLRAVFSSSAFLRTSGGPASNGADLSFLSVEKPGSFIVDYDVPNKDVRLQFMNTVNLMDKPLHWTYTHCWKDNRTVLNGTLVLDMANKVSASYELWSSYRKLKYTHVWKGATTFEPCYDFGRNSLDLSISVCCDDGEVMRASYETRSKKLGLEWSYKSNFSDQGRTKLRASFNLAEGLRVPTLSAESTWIVQL